MLKWTLPRALVIDGSALQLPRRSGRVHGSRWGAVKELSELGFKQFWNWYQQAFGLENAPV
jgi:hypothetical protein